MLKSWLGGVAQRKKQKRKKKKKKEKNGLAEMLEKENGKKQFEEKNEEHDFDFLGHHFAINRSANE